MTAINEKVKLTPTADIEKFKPGTTCQLIGFVDAIESEKHYPSKRVFKFILNNGAGTRVQINCWNEYIERTKSEVIMDHVIYLENANCVPNSPYNNANFHGAELSIGKYTNIENMGKFNKETCDIAPVEPVVYQEIPLDSIENTLLPWKFKTSGYLKTKITSINADNKTLAKGFFCVTGGTRKLNVTAHFYEDDHNYQRGDLLELTGSILNLKNDEITFIVDGMADIKKKPNDAEEKKTLSWLLQGNQSIILKNAYKRPKYN